MRKLAVVISMLVVGASCLAQEQRERMSREQIKSARIAFLTNRLELSPEVSQKFWPIFNEYEAKKDELSKKYSAQKRKLVADAGGFRNLSDENADKMLDIYMDEKQGRLDLEREYVKRFAKVLNSRQVWRFIRFEGDFRSSLIRRLSKDGEARDRDKGNKRGN